MQANVFLDSFLNGRNKILGAPGFLFFMDEAEAVKKKISDSSWRKTTRHGCRTTTHGGKRHVMIDFAGF